MNELANEVIKHYQVNGKYRMQFERSAVKDRDGFKVEANSDDLEEAYRDAKELYMRAQGMTAPVAKEFKGVTNGNNEIG